MTSLSVWRPQSVRVARAGFFLAAVGAVVASANFFGSMTPVDLGVSPDIEPMIVMLHAGSAILALGVLFVCTGRPSIVVPALRHRGRLFRFRRRLWKRWSLFVQ